MQTSRLVSEGDLFVQFWRTGQRPDQFADAVRNLEGFADGGGIEQSKSAGCRDHRPLREFPRISSRRRSFEPAQEDCCRIGGIDSCPSGHYSICNRSTVLHEVQRMPIRKEHVESFMRIERNDIWLYAAHALEGTGRATMQSGVSSSN